MDYSQMIKITFALKSSIAYIPSSPERFRLSVRLLHFCIKEVNFV